MERGMYPFLKLGGNPFERGKHYGRAFADKVEASIENYKEMFLDYNGVNWEEARKRALGFLPFIKEYSPKIVEEIKGIAEGAGKDFEDILTLNSRSEIVLDSAVDGCTSFGITPAMTSRRKTFLCQNWDWIRRQAGSLVVLEIEQPPEPTVLMIAEAGIVSGKGINSAGLGVAFNALTTGEGKQGLPVHILLRGILDARHMADAVQAVAVVERAGSGNFMIASRDGEVIDIEVAPEDFWVFCAEGDWLTHTNHFRATNLLTRVNDKGKVILPDSFQRLARINTLLTENAGNICFEQCVAFLSDHTNYPDSICRHEDPRDPEGKRLASVYGIVMDLTEGIIWISPSNPCLGSFKACGPLKPAPGPALSLKEITK